MAATYQWTGVSSTAYATGGNFTPSGPPATSTDTLIVDQNATRAIAGSDQSATTLAALNILATNGQFVGDNGTPLKINGTNVRLFDPSASGIQTVGSGRINLDLATGATSIVVVGSAQAGADTGKEPIRIKAVNVANVATIQGGIVGFATDNPGDVATFSQISVVGNAIVNIGSGVTLATLLASAGTTLMKCGATLLRQTGGIVTTQGSGAITTATINGQCTLNSTGTITTLQVGDGGTADFTQDVRAKTVTNCKLYKGAKLKITSAVVFANPIQLIDCDLSDVSIITGGNVSLVPAYL